MEKVSDRIIDRAVELWARKLHVPVFDNGDKSDVGFTGMMLATLNIENDKAKMSDPEKAIVAFKDGLTTKLKQLRDDPGEEYFPSWLDTDYHPCKVLADAADKAGIPHSQFSCKSSVSMQESCVSTSFGYGAGHLYHYPLNNGSWLITTLTGSDADMEKIKSDALGKNVLNWEVEKPVTTLTRH